MITQTITMVRRKTSITATFAVLKRNEIKDYWTRFFKTVFLVIFLITLTVSAIWFMFFTESFFAIKVGLSILYFITMSNFMVKTVLVWLER